MLMLMSSGPVDLFVLEFFMAFFVCSSVIVMGVCSSLCISFMIVLLCLLVSCFVVFVNCAVKWFPISSGVFPILLLN